jgi:hypothetical protein
MLNSNEIKPVEASFSYAIELECINLEMEIVAIYQTQLAAEYARE